MTTTERLESLRAAVRAEFCPDPRTAVFDVRFQADGDDLALVGAVSEPAAAEALHRRAALLDGWREVRDAVVRLPEPRKGGFHHAVVTSAIAPMLADPTVATPPVSQVVLGHRLLILRRAGRWLQCRSEDGYLGWVHRGYLVELAEADARGWEMGTVGRGGEAWISLGAELRAEDGEILARLPWGARVVCQDDGTVLLPDGRAGRATGELFPATEQPIRFPGRGEAVVASAAQWLGAPYLWSGVTPAGVDCSGLVQVLFRMHGVELPRDSDQQAELGERVDPGRDFAGLRPGDLCFFAEGADRVTHIAISEGGSRIIHSSLNNGGVARNDLMGETGYERELREIYICARRVFTPES